VSCLLAISYHFSPFLPVLTAIGYPLLIQNDTVKAVAEKLGATPAQVLVAWCTKRGYSVIPKSVKEARIIENFKEVELSDEDYEKVSSIGHNNRIRFVSLHNGEQNKRLTLRFYFQIQHSIPLQALNVGYLHL
jgi:diketogulonate reductase-like aldo/keto reductase